MSRAAARAIPPEVLAVPQGVRERVRGEVRRRQRAGEPLTNRDVRKACAPAGTDAVALLLRLVAAGDLDPSAPWVVAPSPRRAPRASRPRPRTPPKRPARHAADDGEPDDVDLESLSAEILAARSHDELQGLAQRCAALVAQGGIELRAANVITGLLTEARQNQAATVKAQPPEPEAERVLLTTPQAYDLVAAFTAIVNPDRRAAILAHVTAEAAADRVEHPNRVNKDEP